MLLAMLGANLATADDLINPCPRPTLVLQETRWGFDQGMDGWAAENQCTLKSAGGLLIVESAGEDPYFHCPVDLPGGHIRLRLRARGQTRGAGMVFWTTPDSPRGEDKRVGFALHSDGQWHEYETRFESQGRLIDLRIDPGSSPGSFDVDWIQLIHEEPHPLTIDRAETLPDRVRFSVTNHRAVPVEFSALGALQKLAGQSTLVLDVPLKKERALETAALELTADGLPPVRRQVFVHHPEMQADWLVQQGAGFALRVARDGSLARIERDNVLLAIIAPLVHDEGRIPPLRLTSEQPAIRFAGDGVQVEVQAAGAEIRVQVRGERRWTGPTVRVCGGLEQGLLAGLEYLGKGERSSSQLDVETEEHLRFAPDPLKVTLPLMAFVTDQVSLAMTWSDMTLQPLYATPNFFDCAADHLMALQGTQIEATIHVSRATAEEAVLWAVKKRGLPPLPAAPRSAEEQQQLCLQALQGPLKTEKGWGHCVEESWERRPYASMPSTLFRLTGAIPEVPTVVPGGAHVENDAIYFLTGRVAEWQRVRRGEVQHLLAGQQPDGSYRYDGPFRRGHFEDTASGVCAHPAARLLEYAWLTGDETAKAAGLRTLDYMQRFRTPRGAQVWEVPLHTPDQLASASLVWAYVRGFELTGKQEYLQSARKWALSGIPFVYLWGCHPIMVYGTPPVFGSTHWRGTCWLGRPVQWVGGVYAYALTKLAPHDQSLDWNHLARGILLAAEQMQYPDGPYAGLLPDAFDIAQQERVPARINPCALVSLRWVLDGKLDSLAMAQDGSHRVVAPFPVSLRGDKALVKGQKGVTYQVLVDGTRVIDVTSQGEDVIDIDPANDFSDALQQGILREGEARTQMDMFVLARIPELKPAATAEAWQQEAAALRQRVLDEVIFRGVPADWRSAKPQVVWDQTIATEKGYRLRKLRFEALPGFWVPAVLYEPDQLTGKVPAILNVNGHASTGKQTPYKQLRCINLAKRGMLALNLEWIGMGQLRGAGYSHNHLAMLDLCGCSGVSVFYQAMAAGLNVLLDHPHVDLERTAVTGLSGGGWQTIILSSLDTHVKLAVPVAGHSSLKQRIPNRSSIGDLEQNPVDLVSIADYAHLTALMAPRPTLLIYNAKDDCCFVAETVKPNTYDPVVPIYQQANAATAFEYYVNKDPGTHNYERDNREQFYRFLQKHFLAGQSVSTEDIPSDSEVQSAEALDVPLPPDNATFFSLAADVSRNLPKQDGDANPARQRERLKSLLRSTELTATITPAGAEEIIAGRSLARFRVQAGVEWTIPAITVRTERAQRWTLLMADEGFAAKAAAMDELLAAGSQVLAIDPSLIGQAQPGGPLAMDAMVLGTVGQRPLGIQVAQVLAAVEAFRVSEAMGAIDVRTVGPRSGLIGLCAAALNPKWFGRITSEGLPDTLKAFLQPSASYDQAPEIYCFGLLEWFDRPELERLAAQKE
jgi:dienelactone hydrolase